MVTKLSLSDDEIVALHAMTKDAKKPATGISDKDFEHLKGKIEQLNLMVNGE